MPACHGEQPFPSLSLREPPLRSGFPLRHARHAGRSPFLALLHCRVTPLLLCRKVGGSLRLRCYGTAPEAHPRPLGAKGCPHCRSAPKCRAMRRWQEDLAVTDDTDFLLRRCLCHPNAHEASACLHASGMRPRRLSSLRRFFPTVIIRAASPAVTPCTKASGIRRVLSTHLRFSPMSSESTRQRHRHLLVISPHGSPLQPPPSTQPVSAPSHYKEQAITVRHAACLAHWSQYRAG